MVERENAGLSTYIWLWARVVLVSVVAIWIYVEYLDILVKSVLGALGVTDEVEKALAAQPSLYYHYTIITALKVVVGVLFWWRAVKLVLLGWPAKFGTDMSTATQTGGIATSAEIGTWVSYNSDTWEFNQRYEGTFWFGLVARKHPNSDKIVRSRIEFLALAFFGWTFMVNEGRMTFYRGDHENRAMRFLQARHRHVSVKPGDRLVANAVRELKNEIVKQGNQTRIDGLKWKKLSGGTYYISDDFHGGLMVTRLKGDRYAVGGSEDAIEVEGLDLVLQVARKRLLGDV